MYLGKSLFESEGRLIGHTSIAMKRHGDAPLFLISSVGDQRWGHPFDFVGHCYFAIFRRRINTLRKSDPGLCLEPILPKFRGITGGNGPESPFNIWSKNRRARRHELAIEVSDKTASL